MLPIPFKCSFQLANKSHQNGIERHILRFLQPLFKDGRPDHDRFFRRAQGTRERRKQGFGHFSFSLSTVRLRILHHLFRSTTRPKGHGSGANKDLDIFRLACPRCGSGFFITCSEAPQAPRDTGAAQTRIWTFFV